MGWRCPLCASQSLLSPHSGSPGTRAAPCLHTFPTPTQRFTGELLQDMVAPLEASSIVCRVDHRTEEDLSIATEGYYGRATMVLRDAAFIWAGSSLKEPLRQSPVCT